MGHPNGGGPAGGGEMGHREVGAAEGPGLRGRSEAAEGGLSPAWIRAAGRRRQGCRAGRWSLFFSFLADGGREVKPPPSYLGSRGPSAAGGGQWAAVRRWRALGCSRRESR